VKYVYDIYKK